MLHPDLRQLLVAGGAALVGVALGAWLGARAERRRGRARLRARFRAGRVAESDAVHTLEALGFEVVDAQVAAAAHVYVEGERVECPVRADYLVRRRGELALVEVKSGAAQRSPAENETRRQLLEYSLVFEGVPLFHLDASSGTLVEVGFAYGAPPRSRTDGAIVAALALGIVAFLAGLVLALR
ncbi:MAG: hypothetical protein U0610_14850 [bacterium]